MNTSWINFIIYVFDINFSKVNIGHSVVKNEVIFLEKIGCYIHQYSDLGSF